MATTSISLSEGKYKFTETEYVLICLRYGEPWREFVGDKAVGALYNHDLALRTENKRLRKALEDIQIAEYAEEIDKIIEAALNPKDGNG